MPVSHIQPMAERYAHPARRHAAVRPELLSGLWPILLLAYAIFLFPPEARFYLLGVNLPVYRLIIIGFALPWIMMFERRKFKMSFADILVLCASAWTIASFNHNYGYDTGFIRAMGVVIDTAGGYLVARICIRSPKDLRLFLLLIIPGIFTAGVFMVAESLSKNFIIRPEFSKLFGQISAYSQGDSNGFLEIKKEFRLGMMRAFSFFSHPILGGLILTSTIILYVNSGIKKWPKYVGIISGMFGFFALSSATIISIILSFALLAMDKILSHVKLFNWYILISIVLIVGLILEVSSNSGLLKFLIRQTLDPQTGYYRIAIWEYGIISIENNPIYGIGYNEYDRPTSLLPSASVDAHFLALGIRDGAFVPLAIFFAMIGVLFSLGSNVGRFSGHDRMIMFGVNGMLFGLFLASMTVTFFGEGLIWFMAWLGIAASLAQFTPRVFSKPPAVLPGARGEAISSLGGAA